MSEQEEKKFKTWWRGFISTWASVIPDIAEFYAGKSWQACAERSKESVTWLINALEEETIKRRQLEIDIKALREFGISLSKVAQTSVPGNYIYIAMRQHKLLDSNGYPTPLLTGNPTALLTGESE